MAFFAIHSPAGLSPSEAERVRQTGLDAIPRERGTYLELLARAGFVDLVEDDLTPQYRETLTAFLEMEERLEESLRAEEGEGFDERLHRRRNSAATSEDGLLLRSLFTARRPG